MLDPGLDRKAVKQPAQLLGRKILQFRTLPRPFEPAFSCSFVQQEKAVSFPYTVEEGKAFILNDYREDTLDSRSFGAVDLSDIDGPLILSLRRRGF